jgi:hypothetical protein
MNAVPFKINDVTVFTEAEGLLRNEGAYLCLEYQTQDGILGVFKSEIKQFRIAAGDIASLTLTKGWFFGKWWGAKIVIQCDSMDALQALPGASQGRIGLSIAARDFEAADNFVYQWHEGAEAPVGAALA